MHSSGSRWRPLLVLLAALALACRGEVDPITGQQSPTTGYPKYEPVPGQAAKDAKTSQRRDKMSGRSQAQKGRKRMMAAMFGDDGDGGSDGGCDADCLEARGAAAIKRGKSFKAALAGVRSDALAGALAVAAASAASRRAETGYGRRQRKETQSVTTATPPHFRLPSTPSPTQLGMWTWSRSWAQAYSFTSSPRPLCSLGFRWQSEWEARRRRTTKHIMRLA